MGRALCLPACCCLWILTGVNGFAVLPQSPKSITAFTNNNTEIQCAVKQEHLDHFGIHWYRRRKETGNYEFLMLMNVLGKITYGSSVSEERFTVSRDKFRCLDILKISSLQRSDSGTYYCAVVPVADLILGEGTDLAVVDAVQPITRATEKRPPCGCKNQDKPQKDSGKKPGKGLSCSIATLVPLTAGAVILLIPLAVTINHLHRFYRRYRRHFHKQPPK